MASSIYVPRPGSIPDRVMELLQQGPVHQNRLMDLLKVDRRTLCMGMIVPIRMGLVEKVKEFSTLAPVPAVGTFFRLTMKKNSAVTVRLERRSQTPVGDTPSAEAIAAANPFGIKCRPEEQLLS